MTGLSWISNLTRTLVGLPVSVAILANHTLRLHRLIPLMVVSNGLTFCVLVQTICVRRYAAPGSIPRTLLVHLYQHSLPRRWGQFTCLHHGNTSDVSAFLLRGYISIPDALISDCYSIEPWTLKWSKQIRTRMYVVLLLRSQPFLISTLKAHMQIYRKIVWRSPILMTA